MERRNNRPDTLTDLKSADAGLDTPILFMVFNRPDLARRVFERIRAVRPCRLFVAADGPRADRHGESELCRETRRLLTMVDWPCDVTTLLRDNNLGVKEAVDSAITWFFEHVEEGIILEDDCLPDPSFFPFCTELLKRYRDDERIMSISGDCFQPDDFDPGASYYFSLYQHIWGWATWRRAWKKYEPSPEKNPCLVDLDWLTLHFDDGRAALYWNKIVTRCIQGKFRTWDYPWMFSCWVQNGLGLVPAKNLVTNIGFDSRGTHTRNRNSTAANRPAHAMSFPLLHPTIILRNADADHAFERAFLCPAACPKPAPESWRRLAFVERALSGTSAGLSAIRQGFGYCSSLGRLPMDILRRVRGSSREDRRLRQMERYHATETTLLGRRIDIVDAPTYLAGRHEIIERRVYDFEAGCTRPRIIDCGANIGLSVIFFKQRYPESRITAFEADPRIAAVLQHNLASFGYTDVCVRQAAVWVHDGELEFCLEGGLSGRLPKGTGDAVQRIKVPSCRLRDLLAEEPVDLLKLDIEGAEAAVLKDCQEFIRKDWIRRLFFEYHSHESEAQPLHELLAIMSAGGYRYHILPAFVRKRPFVDRTLLSGMDLQLNIYAYPVTVR